MKKQTFIQGTIILVVIGMIVKILGLVNRVIIARFLTTEGLGIYMMVMPTFVLIISLSQLGFPIAISKLISENNITKKLTNKKIILSAFKISIINSILLIVLLLLLSRFLANNLLHDRRTYYPLLMLIFFIPLVSFTSILKGYLNGYKIISVPAYSQLIEQIIRIITSVSLVIVLLPYGVELAVCGAILSMSLGELASLIYMIYKIKNKRQFSLILKHEEREDSPSITKDILLISLPATGSRLIGAISHFFEPIVFSIAMISLGISSRYITECYGQIAGYTVSLLLVPSFFTVAIATPLIPIISEAYVKKNEGKISHYFNLAIFLSFITGGIFTIILTLYPKELMQLFFATTDGTVFLSYMAPLFLVYYFQLPISTTLTAINKAKSAMYNTLFGTIIKYGLMYILVTNPDIHVHGLTISIIVNSMIVTILDFLVLRKHIKVKYNFFTIFCSVSLLISTYLLGSILKTTISITSINILIITIFFISILFIFDIGEIKKVRKQIVNH